MSRPLLIGQAPGPNTRPDCPLYPLPATSAGGRLARFMGISERDYLRAFDRVNLLYEFPGKEGKEDRFPPHLARRAATHMLPLLAGRQVILVGRNVATAFGYGELEWFTWAEHHLGQGRDRVRFGVIPHPSGRCRAYNEAGARERARVFLLDAVARKLEEGGCLLEQDERCQVQTASEAPRETEMTP